MFAEVVFPLPFRNRFTYSIPKDLIPFAVKGVRCVVPFGKRTLTGFVVGTAETADVKEDIKPVYDIIDDQPVFDDTDLKFYEWLSNYYVCSLGEALKLGVPAGTGIETKRKLMVDGAFASQLYEKEKNKTSTRAQVLGALSGRSEINFSYLQNLVKRKNIYSVVRSLEQQGAVTTITETGKVKVKPKSQLYVKLTKPVVEIYDAIPAIESRAPQQVKVLLELLSKKDKTASLSDLLKKTGAPHSSVTALEEKELLTVYEKEIERVFTNVYGEEAAEFELTPHQKEVLEEIKADLKQNIFKPYLLHGVTGSGKTQVYIELIKSALGLDKTALLLVPEISLTPQITSRLINHFGSLVTVIHSRMSAGERFDSWRRVMSGKSTVVIGARSALFAPLKNIGIIVVDEEHDSSYKQFDSQPKYHARDAAVMLGAINRCPVVLGSATPSIESMYNAKTGKYKLLEMPERVDDAKLPVIKLVNMIIENKKRKLEGVFSKPLLDKIGDRLKKQEGVIILQNRRGFSTQIYCEDCGEIETCDNCSVPMVFHINKNIIQCHYCSLTKKVPAACTKCGSLSLKYFGTGTERVEDELEYYFPNARIRRIDSDSISKKDSLGNILLQFSKGESDILVGTQMVSKGLDFSRVTLVGVISAETSLWLPDFRADERTFQLLTQVAGRAGRSSTEGEVIIQTHNEKHFTLQRVIRYDYDGFYLQQIREREQTGYPPFSRLCLIETKDLEEEKAKGAALDFYKELAVYSKQLSISAPVTALISRLKGYYRYHIMIKSFKQNDPGGAVLRTAVQNAFIEFNRKSRFRDVRLVYDMDPQSVL